MVIQLSEFEEQFVANAVELFLPDCFGDFCEQNREEDERRICENIVLHLGICI